MWTSQQREALKALGIDAELFLELPDASRVFNTPLSTDNTAATQATPHLYKLGPWALEFSQALPVGRYPWINDLASYIGSKPSLISAAGEKLVQINCDAYAQETLSVDEKKALWALLKPALESRS